MKIFRLRRTKITENRYFWWDSENILPLPKSKKNNTGIGCWKRFLLARIVSDRFNSWNRDWSSVGPFLSKSTSIFRGRVRQIPAAIGAERLTSAATLSLRVSLPRKEPVSPRAENSEKFNLVPNGLLKSIQAHLSSISISKVTSQVICINSVFYDTPTIPTLWPPLHWPSRYQWWCPISGIPLVLTPLPC